MATITVKKHSRPQVDPDAIIARARNLRRLTAQHPICDDLFNQAKVAGRP
jgi:hypothetical protein